MRRSIPIVLALFGCGREGVLGQVELEPECAPLDLACQGDGIDRPLAVGAILPLELASTVPSSSALWLDLEAVDPTVLEVSGNELQGLSSGRTALLATSEEQVIDLTHVWVAEPTRIALRRQDRAAGATISGPVELLVGDEMHLDAVAYADGERLAGRLSGEWSSSSPALQVLETGSPESRRVVARAAGSVTLTMSWKEHQARVAVEVLP